MTHYFQSRGPRQEAALKTHVRAPFLSPLTRVFPPLTSGGPPGTVPLRAAQPAGAPRLPSRGDHLRRGLSAS